MVKLNRPIKIAFVGSLSVGKTTLVNLFRQKFKDKKEVAIVDEVAREYFQKYGMKNRFSVETQGKIQQLILKREQRAHSQRPKIIICDRSVIDSVVYLNSYNNIKGSKLLFERVRFWLPTYDKFFLLSPRGWNYSVDEIRTEDREKRKRVHLNYVHFFRKHSLPVEILTGSLSKRHQRIEEYVGIRF